MSLDRDWQIRLAAMKKMEELRRQGGGLVRAAQLSAGFEFEGERIPLWSSRMGIWRPQQLSQPGAALTIAVSSAALLAMAGIVFLVFLVGRIGLLRKAVEEIASRAVIFNYIFIPLSALSLLVVLFRNVFSRGF